MKPRAHNIAAAAAAAVAVVQPATVVAAAEVPGTVCVTPAATPDTSHVTEAQAFAHPSVAKFIKDLETWYDEEIAKVKADAAKAVAFFKGDAAPNDIHANNSIEAVNAASPAK